MQLSIIIIFHNMRREAPRTLLSLSAAHQQGVNAADYEVIAIDNGSDVPLDAATVQGFGANFRYHYCDTSSVSPVEAVNLGAQLARGVGLALIVDGARMATPGVVANSLAALRGFPNAFVAALSWHLGPDIQPVTIQDGYNQEVEDRLIESIDWPEDGYRLFDIATLAPASRHGFLGGIPPECSWFCLPRQVFLDLGGFDPRFQTPGGGLCNHEFRNRALATQTLQPVALLGEGVFHQVHGGAATNAPPDRRPHKGFWAEYEALFGQPYVAIDSPQPLYLGTMPKAARRFLSSTATEVAPR